MEKDKIIKRIREILFSILDNFDKIYDGNEMIQKNLINQIAQSVNNVRKNFSVRQQSFLYAVFLYAVFLYVAYFESLLSVFRSKLNLEQHTIIKVVSL